VTDDRAAIGALVHSYAARLDAGDLDGVAELFARATYRTSESDVVRSGAEEVRRVYDGVRLYDGSPGTMHLISNLDVVVDGDVASSECSFTVLQAVETVALQPILAGRYIDRFAREDAGWYFTDRLIVAHLRGDLSAHYAR
jgi:ketosteroid isomerase-like protein